MYVLLLSEMMATTPEFVAHKNVPESLFNRRNVGFDVDFLNSMRDSGTLCYIILIVDGVEFAAHKVVLTASSPSIFKRCLLLHSKRKMNQN